MEVWHDDTTIYIQVSPGYKYEVQFDDLTKKRKWGTQSWIWHLREKRWFTKEVEDKFFAICRSNGIELKTTNGM